MEWSLFKKSERNAERDYYKKTQRDRQSEVRKIKPINNKKQTGPEPEWWKPVLWITLIGGWVGFVLFVQYVMSTFHNLNLHNKPVGLFHSFGFEMFYFIVGLFWFGIGYPVFKKKLYAVWMHNNALWMDAEIEEYKNDAYVRTIDHLTNELDICPDVGMGFDGHASTIVGHIMVSNKGIKKVKVPVHDPNVDGYVKRDSQGKIVYETKPMFDEELAHKLFDMSNVPHEFRHFYNATLYDFNPILPKKEGGDGKRRMGGYGRMEYDKLSDVINHEFYVLPTQTARPAGVYFYDKRPVNTILIAITRGGKGQTYIEVAFDVWSREKNKWNLFTTDPKGELLAKFYYPMTVSGFEVIQFNLLKPELTNVFNPLINALQKFRQDDVVKGTSLIDNIVDVLFPDNGEIWNPAAGNMFRRAVYILFDYYLEQEKYIRYLGHKNHTAPEIIESEIDRLYSKVTLYNVYVMIGELAAKTSSDLEFINVDPKGEKVSSKDLMTLLFDASALLPTNALRSLAITANNAIKQIATAPQTLAGIYASLLTGISIYADPTAIALMSGSISESFDVPGMGFPRRFGVQLNHDFIKKYQLTKELAKWKCYQDKEFTKPYDSKDYQHEERIPVTGWLWAYFKGIFKQNESYLTLSIESDGTVAKTFYFKFIKGYKTLNGITYKIDPITKKKIVSGGILVELDPVTKEPKTSEFTTNAFDYATNSYREVQMPIITSSQCYYSERPKFISAITPPHLPVPQKHVLLIIKQIIDEIYAMSYTTKANRKPIVGTRFMLEEFGNIRSGDNGIPNIDTVTSIALGQDLQLTFVLQSFQQLRSLYGEDVEKIIRANAANIIFLKSNDEELINELVRLSGVIHEVRTKNYSVARKMGDLVTVAEPLLNYSRDQQESTALTGNDLLFLAGSSPGNSITFMSNEMPIVNKQAHIMPMAAGLHTKLPQPVGGQYSDSTLPSTNSNDGMNFLENTIDGEGLVRARVAQAKIALDVKQRILDIAKQHDVDISERNGELASIMMNTVYELYERQSGESRIELANATPYHELADQLMRDIVNLQNKTASKQERLLAASRVRETLVMCAMDKELDAITSIYRDATSDGPLGYDPEKVGAFVRQFIDKYPKPLPLAIKKQDVFEMASKNASYTPYDDGSLLFDIRNSYHAQAFENLIIDLLDDNVTLDNMSAIQKQKSKKQTIYDIKVGDRIVCTYKTYDNSYLIDYLLDAKQLFSVLEKYANVLQYLMSALNDI